MPSNGKSSHCLWQGELKSCDHVVMKCVKTSVWKSVNMPNIL
jgi:hypothetical protein